MNRFLILFAPFMLHSHACPADVEAQKGAHAKDIERRKCRRHGTLEKTKSSAETTGDYETEKEQEESQVRLHEIGHANGQN